MPVVVVVDAGDEAVGVGLQHGVEARRRRGRWRGRRRRPRATTASSDEDDAEPEEHAGLQGADAGRASAVSTGLDAGRCRRLSRLPGDVAGAGAWRCRRSSVSRSTGPASTARTGKSPRTGWRSAALHARRTGRPARPGRPTAGRRRRWRSARRSRAPVSSSSDSMPTANSSGVRVGRAAPAAASLGGRRDGVACRR